MKVDKNELLQPTFKIKIQSSNLTKSLQSNCVTVNIKKSEITNYFEKNCKKININDYLNVNDKLATIDTENIKHISSTSESKYHKISKSPICDYTIRYFVEDEECLNNSSSTKENIYHHNNRNILKQPRLKEKPFVNKTLDGKNLFKSFETIENISNNNNNR